jgi:hypothetical protein
MHMFFIAGTAGQGPSQAFCGSPFMDFCSLMLFIGGAFLLAVAVYHLKKAPDQPESPYH